MEREPARRFTDLIVWQKAHRFVLAIYQICQVFPKNELYGLTSQLRRAAISVPANIAEGFTMKSKVEKARFLNIAQSSSEECRYYLILTNDLKFGDVSKLMERLEEVGKLLYGYGRRLK